MHVLQPAVEISGDSSNNGGRLGAYEGINGTFVDFKCVRIEIQSNLDGSNTDGSFTMANSNSFLSPYEILPIAQENKYLRKFSYFLS